MTTLIVGCGYLGRRIGRALSLRGERVFGTTRSTTTAGTIERWGIEPTIADVLDHSSLRGLPPADRVVSCVGYDRSSGASMRSVYVDGLRAFLSSLRQHPQRLVYASSTGVYGQSAGEWVDENSATEPVSESGRICLEAEAALRGFGDEAGVSIVCIRYSGLYGPGRIVRRDAVARGEVLSGDPERYLNLIHIDDAASAAIAALDAAHPSSLYVASDDRPVRRREYYELVARHLSAPLPRFTTRDEAGTPGRDDSNKRVSNHRIKADIGFEPRFRDISQGVPDALARCDEPD
jgi:nucleoside-diphosphate-sugar epimerase